MCVCVCVLWVGGLFCLFLCFFLVDDRAGFSRFKHIFFHNSGDIAKKKRAESLKVF